jgi:outer membrane protein TolC
MQSLVRQLQQGSGALLQPPDEVPLAVPAKAILGRPDVAAAEQMMAAQSADIGVQTAKVLPSLSLLGNIGINTSSGAGGTLSSWSFGPTLTLPTLDPRVVRVTRQGAQAAYQAAYAAWRATVRAAALEVSKTLVQLRIASAQYAAIKASAALAEEQHALAQARLSAGTATQLDLEQAQAAVLSARSAQVSAQLTQTQSWVALFKATASNLAGLTPRPSSTQ